MLEGDSTPSERSSAPSTSTLVSTAGARLRGWILIKDPADGSDSSSSFHVVRGIVLTFPFDSVPALHHLQSGSVCLMTMFQNK